MRTNLIRITLGLGLILTASPVYAASTIDISRLPIGQERLIIPAGDSAKALAFRLQGACGMDTSSIKSMTLVHEGTGSVADIHDISFSDGAGAHITTKFRGFDTWSNTTTVHFQKPLSIPACSSVDLAAHVTFSVSAKAGGSHLLMLELPTDVVPKTADTTVTGTSLRLRGPELVVVASKKVSDVCSGGTSKDRKLCRKARRVRR